MAYRFIYFPRNNMHFIFLLVGFFVNVKKDCIANKRKPEQLHSYCDHILPKEVKATSYKLEISEKPSCISAKLEYDDKKPKEHKKEETKIFEIHLFECKFTAVNPNNNNDVNYYIGEAYHVSKEGNIKNSFLKYEEVENNNHPGRFMVLKDKFEGV